VSDDQLKRVLSGLRSLTTELRRTNANLAVLKSMSTELENLAGTIQKRKDVDTPIVADMTEGKSARPDKVTGLGAIKGVIECFAFMGVLLYVAGWSYLYGYYRRFNIGIKELDITAYDTFVFAMKVVSAEILGVLTSVLVLVGLGTVVWRWRRSSETAFRIAALSALMVGPFLLSVVGVQVGDSEAAKQLRKSSCALPSLVAQLDSAKAPAYLIELDDPAKGYVARSKYRLLLHAKGNYYLIKPYDDSLTSVTGEGLLTDVVVLPESIVQGLWLETSAK
jgi:hypothetical protein